jgi:hypothetical protein
MPLDVCYGREDGDHQLAFQLHDNAHYWFLHPWFVRLHKSIGKYVDLYGDVELDKSSGLTALAQALGEAKRRQSVNQASGKCTSELSCGRCARSCARRSVALSYCKSFRSFRRWLSRPPCRTESSSSLGTETRVP